MKKRVVGLLLSLVMSFSLFGCGNNAETKQETGAGTEQEETKEEAKEETKEESPAYDEFEFFYSTTKLDLDNTIPCNLDNLSPNGSYCGEWNLTGSIDLYAERDGKACVIGYTKENIPVNVYNSSDEWIMLYFEKEEQPNTYKLAKAEDFLANSDYDESVATNTEYNYDNSDPTAIFRQVLQNGGMEPSLDLINAREDINDSDGAMIDIPKENTAEWAEEKLEEFLNSGIKYFDTEGYSFTDYSDGIKLRLGTEKDKPLSEDEIKAFFNSEADIELRKKLNPNLLILDEIGYDENKTYTMDEYVEFFIRILEGMGKTNNVELVQINPMDNHEGFHIESIYNQTDFSSENIEYIMNYMEYGKDGYGGITEFCVLKGKNEAGEETINIIVKVDHSQRITE